MTTIEMALAGLTLALKLYAKLSGEPVDLEALAKSCEDR